MILATVDLAVKTLDVAAGGGSGGGWAAWIEVGLSQGFSVPHHMGSHAEGQEGEQGLWGALGAIRGPTGCPTLGAGGVRLEAGGVGHGVSDVVLLLHPVEEVGHGALGQHYHVLPTVGLRLQRNRCLLPVVLVFCRVGKRSGVGGSRLPYPLQGWGVQLPLPGHEGESHPSDS